MPDDDVPTFKSTDEELRYWRSTARDLQDQLADAKSALDEIDSGGRELEEELERDLQETERREKELRAVNERLRSEADDAKTRYQSTLREHAATLAHMQTALDAVRQSEEALRLRVRDMELDNDDLEKSERAMSSTLQDVESRYGRAIERTAMLEQELVVKAMLEEETQRLKDELRETTEELAVLRVHRSSAPLPIARPMTPPGSGDQLPLSVPSTPSSSVGGEDTTPRKLADVQASAARRAAMTPDRVSPSKIPSPSVPIRTAKSTATDFHERKDRILRARTDRRTFAAFGSSIPRPTSSVRSRRVSLAPNGDESPIVAAQRRIPTASQPRRPPSRMSASTAGSSSRPSTPMLDGRSPTPSSLRASTMGPPDTPNRRKSMGIPRPSSALGHRAPPPPLPTAGHAFGSTFRAPTSTQARRVSLRSSLASSATPPNTVPRARPPVPSP